MICDIICAFTFFMPFIPVLHFLSNQNDCMILYPLQRSNNSMIYDLAHFFICILELSIPALSKTAASILECVLRRDPHEAEYIQSIQEVVHSLEPVLVKNTQ